MTLIQKIIYSVLGVVIIALLVTTCVYKKKYDTQLIYFQVNKNKFV